MNKFSGFRVRHPSDVVDVLERYRRKRQEHFVVVTLNYDHEVIKVHVVTIGLVNKTIIHPREVYWHAVKDFASAVVVAHNHPSGNTFPSAEDNEITERLMSAAEVLGFHFLDHLILGKDSYYSYGTERKWGQAEIRNIKVAE